MQSWLEGRNWVGKCAQATGMTASLRILSSKADSNTWESFTRSELKLESVHQESPRSDIFRKRATKPLLKQKHRQKQNVMSELLSHRLQSPSRAPPTVLLPNPQTASLHAMLSNNNTETCWKGSFNKWNQIGRPVTLHSHSRDGRSNRTVTMRWITSNMMYSKDKLTVSV